MELRDMYYRAVLAVLLAGTTLLTLVVAGAPGRAVAGSPGCSWRSVNPKVPDLFVDLHAVDGSSTDDVWAVGSERAGGRPLILRRKAGKWSTVAGPAPLNGILRAVDARTPTDVWAVGNQLPTGATNLRTLIQHFDGKSWKVVKSPNPFPGANILKGVIALAADDVWAVGGNGIPGSRAMILHFDGTRWTRQRVPVIPSQADLADIDRYFDTDELIAVGRRGGTSDRRQLVLSYNGKSWKQEPLDDPSSNGKEFFGVSNSVAVGAQSGVAALRTFGMMRRLDAATQKPLDWQPVPTQDSGAGVNLLNAVSLQAKQDTYRGFAVGYYETPSFVSRTLILEFSGKPVRWTKVASPNLGAGHNQLKGVYVAPLAAQSHTVRAWAVGTAGKPIGSAPIILEYAC